MSYLPHIHSSKLSAGALQAVTPIPGQRPLASHTWQDADADDIRSEQDQVDLRGNGISPDPDAAPAEEGAREGSRAHDGPETGESSAYDSDFIDDADASQALHSVSSPDAISRRCSASSTTSGSASAQQHGTPDKGMVDLTSKTAPVEPADPPSPHGVIQLRSGRKIMRRDSEEPEADVQSGDSSEQHPNSNPPGQPGSGLQRGTALRSGRKVCELSSCGEQGLVDQNSPGLKEGQGPIPPLPHDAGAFVATPNKGLRRIEKRGLLDETSGPAGPSALEQVDKLKRKRYQPVDSDSDSDG